MVLSEIVRQAAPEIHTQIKAVTQEGERVGRDASTLYYCTNFTAPLHFDNDAGPGLCATLELDADPHEYCFLNLAYPFYFAPRAGSLWYCGRLPRQCTPLTSFRSFRGSDLHGTTLPSLKERQGGRKRVSNTSHKTKPDKNAKSARQYQLARRLHHAVEEFWG